VARPRPKNVVLIVARELASNLPTPVFLVDARGYVVFYNEPAEAILGRAFSEFGEIPADEWRLLFSPETPAGTAAGVDELPSAFAFRERRPVHRTLSIRSLDGAGRKIESTALPLFARGREFVGVLVFFWERGAGAAAE
jgi:PAS domain-containing protein